MAYLDLKKTLLIGTIISASAFLVQFVILLATSLAGSASSSNAGMLVTSYGMYAITFMIGIFADTANGQMKNLFRFPINRPTYAVGMLINLFAAPLAIIAAVSLFQVLESLTYTVLSAFLENLRYLNNLTVASYLEGLLPTYAMTVYALSMVYMLSMYFHRFKLPFTIALVALIVVYIMVGPFRVAFNRAFVYPFTQNTIPAFTLCMLGLSLVFHALAFAPLKTMEVKS